jgi:nanoRNase/pAp phosphatase (c-di-AMP/oligoRNAs hydrolase)
MVKPRKAAGSDSGSAAQLLRFLSERRRAISPLLILIHDYPDPDALASAFGLLHLAREAFGVESRIVHRGAIGRTENRAMVQILEIPARRLRGDDLKRHRRVALVDTQPAFENNPFPVRRRATLVIDQHPSSRKPAADLALVDPTCGATCVIIAQALLRSGLRVPKKLATALVYGILSDTLDLYRASHPDIIQTYLDLLPRCDIRRLARIQNPVRSRRFFAALARGMDDAVARGPLIVSHLGPVDSPDLVSETAEFFLTYEKARWVLCTGRHEGKLHISLRTSGSRTSAGQVLRDVSPDQRLAGGHGAIAGGSFLVGTEAPEKTWTVIEQDLQRRLTRRLRIPLKGGFRRPFAR